MKTLTTPLTAQAEATEQAPILLAELSGWGGSTVRWAGTDADVVAGVGDNLVSSADLTTWTTYGTPVVTDLGTGWYTVEDDSTSVYESVYDGAVVADDATAYIVALDVLKDSDETRFMQMQIVFSGAPTSVNYSAQVNTATGAVSLYPYNVGVATVADCGTHWRVRLRGANSATGNTVCTFHLWPAYSSSWELSQATALGTITARNPAMVAAATYDARPLQVGGVELDAGGKAAALTLGVANHDLAISTLVDTATPVGASLTVRRVFLDDLTVAQTLVSGLSVRSYRITETAVEFACEGLGTLLRRPVPARVLGRSCPWEFKGTLCGYSGAETECDHTAEDCDTTKANFVNFGGFLHVLPGGAR